MADSLPSPPESRSSTPDETTNTGALTARLDGLLEQYLELLDQYTTLREQLSKTFSSGFFSLAQAQRASTLGAGRRYGEECYDERMKAQRKLSWTSVDTNEGDLKCRITREEEVFTSGSEKEGTKETLTNNAKGSKELGADESIKQHDQKMENNTDGKDTHSRAARPKQDPAKRDPLTWFGVLVPPTLRQTQAHFVKATEDQIPKLLATDLKMKSIERQVWAFRDELGISSDYESWVSETEEAEKVTEAARDDKPVESTTDSRVSRKSLTSRSAHSKSHLLKLGD